MLIIHGEGGTTPPRRPTLGAERRNAAAQQGHGEHQHPSGAVGLRVSQRGEENQIELDGKVEKKEARRMRPTAAAEAARASRGSRATAAI